MWIPYCAPACPDQFVNVTSLRGLAHNSKLNLYYERKTVTMSMNHSLTACKLAELMRKSISGQRNEHLRLFKCKCKPDCYGYSKTIDTRLGCTLNAVDDNVIYLVINWVKCSLSRSWSGRKAQRSYEYAITLG